MVCVNMSTLELQVKKHNSKFKCPKQRKKTFNQNIEKLMFFMVKLCHLLVSFVFKK